MYIGSSKFFNRGTNSSMLLTKIYMFRVKCDLMLRCSRNSNCHFFIIRDSLPLVICYFDTELSICFVFEVDFLLEFSSCALIAMAKCTLQAGDAIIKQIRSLNSFAQLLLVFYVSTTCKFFQSYALHTSF